MRPHNLLVGASVVAALLAACSGGQPWDPGEGGTASVGGDGGGRSTSSGSGGSSGSTTTDSGSGSSSGGPVGGSCTSCASDTDCTTFCGPTPTYGYFWCCGGGQQGCYQWMTSMCPSASSGSGGGSGGSSGGSSGSSSGGGSGSSSGAGACGASGQNCCMTTPRCMTGKCTGGMCP
jgi:hypothetical protein